MGGTPLESLMVSFKPDRIRLLFVGESPPAKGFFYCPERYSTLSRCTREAFEEIYDVKYPSKLDFLKDFKRRKCYLVDLTNERGKRARSLTGEERRQATHRLCASSERMNPKSLWLC